MNTSTPSKTLRMKEKLTDILTIVSWSEISRTYFGKSNSWLYHKMNGIDGNKKPTDFSESDLLILKGALSDIADRIRRAADSI